MRIRSGIVGVIAVAALCTAGCSGGGDPITGIGTTGAGTTEAGTTGVGTTGASQSGSAAVPSGAHFTDQAGATTILTAARKDVELTNSYDYRHLDDALAAGLQVATGAYREQYRSAFVGLISKNAPKQHFIQKATVNSVGLGPVAGSVATVLAFGQLDITSTSTGAQGRKDPFALTAQLRNVGGTWLIERVDLDGSITAGPAGTPDLAAAAAAARSGIGYTLTLSRATFDADYARAVAATTGSLRTELAAQKAKTLTTLTTGKLDLTAIVRATATESASGESAKFLISVDGYRVTAGTRSAPTRQNLEVSVQRVGGAWKLSDIMSIGVS